MQHGAGVPASAGNAPDALAAQIAGELMAINTQTGTLYLAVPL